MSTENTTDEAGLPPVTCSACAAAIEASELRWVKCGGFLVSPGNLDMVIGERDAARESLLEIYNAMVRYEGDVDGDAPPEHRRMMDRIRGILFSENNPLSRRPG